MTSRFTRRTNFLRGAQRTNASGVATFRSIYPGWYPGRAVHTGQLFFPAAITNSVYRKAPYRSHGTTPDTPNGSDAIYRNGGDKGMLTLKRQGPAGSARSRWACTRRSSPSCTWRPRHRQPAARAHRPPPRQSRAAAGAAA